MLFSDVLFGIVGIIVAARDVGAAEDEVVFDRGLVARDNEGQDSIDID